MSLPTSLSSASSRCTNFFLLSSRGAGRDDSSAAQSIIETITPFGGPIGAFVVNSTVKGAGPTATGRIDLMVTFDGFVASTFTDNNRLVIYSIATQTKQNQSTLPERARTMIVDHDSRYIIIGSITGRIRIYALATGQMVCDVKTHHDRGVNALAIDRASKWLVAGGEDGVVSVYDFGSLISSTAGVSVSRSSTASLVLSIADHTLAITTLQITSTNMLLTASKDGGVRLYQLEQPLSNEVSSLAASSSGSSAPAPPCIWHHAFRSVVHAALLDHTESIVYVAVKENIHWLSLYARGPSSSSSSSPSSSVPGTWRGHATNVISLAIDASSSHLISVDAEGIVKIWEGGSLSFGSLPTAFGTCLKTLAGARTGCKQIHYVQLPSSSSSSSSVDANTGNVATLNQWYLQQPSVRGGGNSNQSGLQGKEGSWIFPPLNSSAVTMTQMMTPQSINQAGNIFVPLSITPHTAVNHELTHRSVRNFDTALSRKKRSWFESASDDLQLSSQQQQQYSHWSDEEDRQLVSGKSGWTSLTETQTKRDERRDALQNQAETYETHAKELYQLCVEKVFREINNK